MEKETEINSGEESQGKDSNDLKQDDISTLIDEMQDEKNSSETKDQAKKSKGEKTEQDPVETKDTGHEGKDTNSLNQDKVSQLIDEVQTEEKSSKSVKKEDKTEHVKKENEDEKSTESEKPEDENAQPSENIDEDVNEKNGEEQAESQENDEENNDGVKGLESDDETEVDADSENDPGNDVDTGSDVEPDVKTDTEKDEIDSEDNDNTSKKNKEDKKSENDDRSVPAVKLKEVKNKPKGKRVKLLISCSLCIVFIVVIFGLYTLFKKSETNNIKLEKPVQPEQITITDNKSNEEQNVQHIKDDENKGVILSDSIIAKLDEITELKDELVIKEREIADLIKNYKNGIGEMEDEILWVKQNNQIDSLNDAIKNKKIEFGMMTIQRRLAYIEKIDPPYRWLNQGIEELLYLKSKIKIDSKISRVISGVDMDKMIQEIDIVTQSYRTDFENLKIDMKNIKLTPFELIWQRIIDKEKFSEVNTQKDNKPVGLKKTVFTGEEEINRIIWEEICGGNFKRKNEMTTLSIGAAKCLSKWKHADLIVNGLSDLSPKVARHLLKWEGNWICLNGVKELSPEAGRHLFQWQGNWISLNGLSQISPGILKYLPQWQGKQLELMGLKYQRNLSEKVGLRSLAKWEKSGGKLYISAQIRKVIKQL